MGIFVGDVDGLIVGTPVGCPEGDTEGPAVGVSVGCAEGNAVGAVLGLPVGLDVGVAVGRVVGCPLGLGDGAGETHVLHMIGQIALISLHRVTPKIKQCGESTTPLQVSTVDELVGCALTPPTNTDDKVSKDTRDRMKRERRHRGKGRFVVNETAIGIVEISES